MTLGIKYIPWKTIHKYQFGQTWWLDTNSPEGSHPGQL